MGTSLNTVPTTERELNELLQGYCTDAKERYDNRKAVIIWTAGNNYI